MVLLYPSFGRNLKRYLLDGGDYPSECAVRTPCGKVSPTLFSHHDLLTVNEVFCRLDYPAPRDVEVVVDIGSNIGISALFFLTRNLDVRCYCYEPVPENAARLRANLADHEDRYELQQVAVGPIAGRVNFGVEPTGRYGGVGLPFEQSITVDCLAIADVVAGVLAREPTISVLKIDTEGLERDTVQAIPEAQLERIEEIYFETPNPAPVHENRFAHEYDTGIARLRRRVDGATG